MSIELTIVISVISLCLTIFATATTAQRNSKQDNQSEGKETGQIIAEIKNLSQLVQTLDKKFDNQTKDLNGIRERVSKLETANKLIKDSLTKMYGDIEELKKK